MKFIFTIIAAMLFIAAITPAKAYSAEKTAGSSAVLSNLTPVEKADNRVKILQAFLEQYNSPLSAYADTIVFNADKNKIDWRLIPAIAGVESYFGQMIPSYSYNAWGYGIYGSNVRRFSSWEDGIETVSKAIRDDYMDKWGAANIYEIGSIYAADRLWANKTENFLNKISYFEEQYSNNTLSISL